MKWIGKYHKGGVSCVQSCFHFILKNVPRLHLMSLLVVEAFVFKNCLEVKRRL